MKRFLLTLLLFLSTVVLFAQNQPLKSRIGSMHVTDSDGKIHTGVLFEIVSNEKIEYEVYVIDREAFFKVVKNSEFRESEQRRRQNCEKYYNYCASYPDACVNYQGGGKLYLDFDAELRFAEHH